MKLPDHAKKVFEGIIFTVYQWEQELFNGKKATFEMLKRASTLTVIAVHDGEIVLAEEEQPGRARNITLFGGRQEDDEDPLEGARRELLEESGLVSDDWELFRVYNPLLKLDWEIYVFIARNCKRIAGQELDGGERITEKRVSFDEFLSVVSSPEFHDRDLALDIMRMRLNPDSSELEELKAMLFPRVEST